MFAARRMQNALCTDVWLVLGIGGFCDSGKFEGGMKSTLGNFSSNSVVRHGRRIPPRRSCSHNALLNHDAMALVASLRRSVG